MSFTWEPFQGAVSYRLKIISLTGKKVVFTTNKPSHDRYVESLPWGGVFTWQVVALDVQGKPIGFAGAFTFEKPLPPPKARPNENRERGGDTSSPSGPTVGDGGGSDQGGPARGPLPGV